MYYGTHTWPTYLSHLGVKFFKKQNPRKNQSNLGKLFRIYYWVGNLGGKIFGVF
jgi:hypothetical protein